MCIRDRYSSAKTLQISYIGMQTQEVAIKPNLKVVLKPDTEVLDEVVVTGYGTLSLIHIYNVTRIGLPSLSSVSTPVERSQQNHCRRISLDVYKRQQLECCRDGFR